jgi:hypothetical protein
MSIEAPKQIHDTDILAQAEQIAQEYHPWIDRVERKREGDRHKGCLCTSCCNRAIREANREIDWIVEDNDAEFFARSYVLAKDKRGKNRILHPNEVNAFYGNQGGDAS